MRIVCLLLLCLTSFVFGTEKTLIMVKPDVVRENKEAQVLEQLSSRGLKIVGLKMTQLTKERASEFYSILKDKSFYPALVAYMSSGPIVAAVLEAPDAVSLGRTVIGATDPAKAELGTIRKNFGKNIQQNAIHGSDSVENAKNEIAFFFGPNEIYGQ